MSEQNDQKNGTEQEQSQYRQQYRSQYQPQYQYRPQQSQAQYQSQYQSQYQTQYQPQPQYQEQYRPQLQVGRGGGWITLLRVLLWIQFSCIVLAGVVGFILTARYDAVLGFAILIAAVVFAFLSVALGMVLLDAVQNVKSMTDNSALIGASILRKEQEK